MKLLSLTIKPNITYSDYSTVFIALHLTPTEAYDFTVSEQATIKIPDGASLLMPLVSKKVRKSKQPSENTADNGKVLYLLLRASAIPVSARLGEFQDFIRAADTIEHLFSVNSANACGPCSRKRTIVDPEKIVELCSEIKLTPGISCECESLERIVFWKEGQSLTAEVCAHCLNIITTDREVHCFEMPQAINEGILGQSLMDMSVEQAVKTYFQPNGRRLRKMRRAIKRGCRRADSR